jgi:hypothetical protein
MSGEPSQNGVPEPIAGPEPSGALGGGAELVVGSIVELAQRLSDGQRGQTEVLGRLVEAIDNLTAAHTALHDDLARLRAEVRSSDGDHAVIDAGDRDALRALREQARQVRRHARETAGRDPDR